MKIDLSNQQFGRWKVLPMYRYQKGNKQWLCECSCKTGTRRFVYETNLLRGLSKSCGCYSRELARERHIDLRGRRFGELKVISKAENKKDRVAWNCECSCGKHKILTTHDLLQDQRKNCGDKVHVIGKHIRDLTQLELEAMEALSPTVKRDSKGSVIWKCRCKKCGRERELSEDALVHGNYKSCGCARYEHIDRLMQYRHYYEGTCLETLGRKIRFDNTTGVAGVTRTKSGRYRAKISFQGKPYALGIYDTIAEAAGARKTAEEQLHVPFIHAYTAWMESGEKEEFVFKVNFINGEFYVESNYLKESGEIREGNDKNGIIYGD